MQKTRPATKTKKHPHPMFGLKQELERQTCSGSCWAAKKKKSKPSSPAGKICLWGEKFLHNHIQQIWNTNSRDANWSHFSLFHLWVTAHAVLQHTAANCFRRKTGNGAWKPVSLTSCGTKLLLVAWECRLEVQFPSGLLVRVVTTILLLFLSCGSEVQICPLPNSKTRLPSCD